MAPYYRHTQVGWAILAAFVAVGLLVLRLGAPGAGPLGVSGLFVAAMLLVFGALTVEVDDSGIRLWFGVGLVRKRIPLARVTGWQAVRNPWYSGWGIRLGPWGVMWNVSGFDAVELALSDGSRFRIGTDEPAELTAAIARARGMAAGAAPVLAGEPVAPGGSGAGTRWLAAIGLALGLLGGLFWAQMRPPTVSVSRAGLDVRGFVYRASIPAEHVTRVTLETALPRVLRRTNGFALRGTLRGRFRVEGLGDGQLFVERDRPPFVLVRHREGFLVLNFEDPARTRALFDALAGAWPERVATAG